MNNYHLACIQFLKIEEMGNGSDCTKKMNVLDATGLNLKASKAIQFMLCVFYHIKENTYLNIKYRCFILIFHRSKAN